MKKILLSSMLFFSPFLLADAKLDLQKELSKLTSFDAHFKQTVFDEQKQPLQHAKGQLQLQQPNQMRWQQEDTLLVSHGEKTYFFDAFAEQVTIMNTESLIDSTPFVLLTHHQDKSLWNNYNVTAVNGSYELTPALGQQSQVEKLTLVFDGNGLGFKTILILDSTGQQTQFDFEQNKVNTPLDASLFQFTIPEGVAVDDQSKGE